MLGNTKFIVDSTCEIIDILKPLVSDTFFDFSQCQIDTQAIYIIGRMQFITNKELIRTLIEKHQVRFVFSNPFEGSDTLQKQLVMHGMDDLIKAGKILVIGGGDMDLAWPYIRYDLFLTKIHDFDENKKACEQSDEIYSKLSKPYTFLFLNGRGRPHRKWLVEKLNLLGLLDQAIWTWLDPSATRSKFLKLKVDGIDLMGQPRDLHLLNKKYEVEKYADRLEVPKGTVFAKYDLFDNQWGEIYIKADPYIDTYFSVVTETVFDYPYSFRTEKIWKPIAIGHPWIVAANKGFLRDIKNLGFKTFGHLVNESYDCVDDNTERLERIADVIKTLCNEDLAKFLSAAQDVCKYNQQHLVEIRNPIKKQFPMEFINFLKAHQWIT